jgi:hypothetical protein
MDQPSFAAPNTLPTYPSQEIGPSPHNNVKSYQPYLTPG